MLATANEIIDGQYADRPLLKLIVIAKINAAAWFGELTIQARKTYVSLQTPRRIFACRKPAKGDRVDLGLRLEELEPGGRLQPCTIHESTPLQISFTSLDEVDAEALSWLKQAYDQNY